MSMDKIWNTAIKVTGPVGVIGGLFWVLMKWLFQESVLAVFGSDKMFILATILIVLLFIALITATLMHKNENKKELNLLKKNPQGNKVTIEKSNISGDFVMGDKTVNTLRKDNDQ